MAAAISSLAKVGRTYASVGWRGPTGAHFGASSEDRALASWNPSSGSADTDTNGDIPVLVSRTRDLVRNNGVASGAVQTLDDNVLGTGLRLSSIPDYKALGRDKSWAYQWSRNTESRFRSWWETTHCDAGNSLKGSGLSSQAFRGWIVNGEALAIPVWLPRPNCRYSTKIQVIESDRLSTPDSMTETKNLRGGVEMDDYGAPQAYYVRKSHPGDWDIALGNNQDWERIPAYTDFWRRRVLHVHDKERSGQSRGKSIFASVLSPFKMLDHYNRTELQCAVIEAMHSQFIETPLESQALVNLYGGDLDSWNENRQEYRIQTKGAAVIPLQPGDKIASQDPKRPNVNYPAFVEALARHIGCALGLPFELLMKNFSKTNYSSARASLLEAWRYFRGRRAMFVDLWMSPIYELWLEEAVSLGEVEAPDYYDNVYAYARCKWIGPPRGWVDPVKEATSAQIRMDANISTLQDECAEQGQDWEEVLEQKATEMAKKVELGLPLTADANLTSLVKALPAEPAEPPADLQDQKVDVQPPEGT